MRELLERIARSLVDRPDAVEVGETTEGERTKLELRVAPEDLGKVIGRQGRTARAIRAVVGSAAAKRMTRVVVEIVET